MSTRRGRMNRREFVRTVAAGGVAGTTAMLLVCKGTPLFAFGKGISAKKPNIIFIMADDLGYGDVSCYGATKVKTPNIDRVAREGVRFTDALSDYKVHPWRYWRWRYSFASGTLVTFIFGPSQINFLPIRMATLPSRTISVSGPA